MALTCCVRLLARADWLACILPACAFWRASRTSRACCPVSFKSETVWLIGLARSPTSETRLLINVLSNLSRPRRLLACTLFSNALRSSTDMKSFWYTNCANPLTISRTSAALSPWLARVDGRKYNLPNKFSISSMASDWANSRFPKVATPSTGLVGPDGVMPAFLAYCLHNCSGKTPIARRASSNPSPLARAKAALQLIFDACRSTEMSPLAPGRRARRLSQTLLLTTCPRPTASKLSARERRALVSFLAADTKSSRTGLTASGSARALRTRSFLFCLTCCMTVLR